MSHIRVPGKFLMLLPVLILVGCWPPINVQLSSTGGTTTDTAIQAPMGTYFLIRRDGEYGAVKLTKTTSKGDGGVAYTWHYQPNESLGFTGESVVNGEGEVFEKYRRVKGTGDSWKVEDDGGELFIVCGELRVEWSQSNWIYFDTPQGPVEIALTGKADIEEIDYLDSGLIWKSGVEK